jgi:hypothetical protein
VIANPSRELVEIVNESNKSIGMITRQIETGRQICLADSIGCMVHGSAINGRTMAFCAISDSGHCLAATS